MTSPRLLLAANATEGSISAFHVTETTLTRSAVTDGFTGCSTFVIDAERSLVYAAVKGAQDGEPAAIVTASLDAKSGLLTPLGRLELPRGGMNYLALTRGGTVLLGAAYSGGYGISCALTEGVVSEPVASVEFANLHSVLASADGRFAYFVSLGDDLIAQYAITDDGHLVALTPQTVSAPAGSGPRHLTFGEEEKDLYVLTEFSGEVLHYRRDTDAGVLELVGSANAVDPAAGLGHSVFGANPREHHYIWGADLHRTGDVLWASERTESALGSLRIGAGGVPADAASFTPTETQPRGFAVSDDGALLVAAGERSDALALYRVEGATLTLQDRAETGAGPNWVRFV